MPEGADVTVSDARKMRQNCAAVLGMVVERLSTSQGERTPPPLQSMSETPEPVAACAELVRQAIAQKTKQRLPGADEAQRAFRRRASSVQLAAPPLPVMLNDVPEKGPLDLVNAASAPDSTVEVSLSKSFSGRRS